jgi:heme O synthase-like polyprenyltransferase
VGLFRAIPFMLGWVCDDFGIEAGTLFYSVFWQFPHLGNWWFLYEDYEKAGFYVANRKKR